MKKSSIRQFTKKCLKAGYKEQVCKNAWIFGKVPTKELQNLYSKTFKTEKTYKWPHTNKQTHAHRRLTEPFAQAERARTWGGFPLRPSVPWRSRPRRGASGTACRACRSAVAATARGAQSLKCDL